MADIIPQSIIEICRVNENVVQFNIQPQSGLTDTFTREESMIQTSVLPQSGLIDTFTREESMTYTN